MSRLTFSRPKSLASAVETMGGWSGTTGAGVAGDWVVPNGFHLPMAMLLATSRAGRGRGARTGEEEKEVVEGKRVRGVE